MSPIEKIGPLFLKREDLNPSGSVKDRALKAQIAHLQKKGFTAATISSTGNAAISAAHFCQKAKIDLEIFLSPKVKPAKLKLIKTLGFPVQLSPTPIKNAFRSAKEKKAYFLRQSTDPIAWQGYQTLGEEILSFPLPISAIFFPVGSGTTLYGTWLAFKKHKKNIPLIAVQPSAHAPIAGYFQSFKKEKENPSDALSAKFLPLKEKLIQAIKESRGQGIVVSSKEFAETAALLKFQKFPALGPETILAISAAYRYLAKNPHLPPPLVIATGCPRL